MYKDCGGGFITCHFTTTFFLSCVTSKKTTTTSTYLCSKVTPDGLEGFWNFESLLMIAAGFNLDVTPGELCIFEASMRNWWLTGLRILL